MEAPVIMWVLPLLLLLSLGRSRLALSVAVGHEVVNTHGICATFVWSRGYDCSEFVVPTKDGFLLSMQRMTSNGFNTGSREPVFLYHGVLEGGEAWVLNEPKESLAFTLADSGYEVWIGSTRTTSFTYGHITYKRTQESFWDWNWDDLVAYDLPAMLRYVNYMTGQPVYYIGYSQGAMTGFAAFTDSEVANLVKKATMLAPVAYLGQTPSPLIKTAATLFLDQVGLLFLHMYEYNPSSPEATQLAQTVCKNAGTSDCRNLSTLLITGPSCCINESRRAYYDRYRESTSVKNLAQLAQLVRTGRFEKYDYGLMGNLIKYWSMFPPSYDLAAIPESLPFFLVHGGRDKIADPEDVRHVADEIPGDVRILFEPNYDHQDFTLGTSAYMDVYPSILEFFH